MRKAKGGEKNDHRRSSQKVEVCLKKKERLEEVCRFAPERFMNGNQINIPDDTKPIYIPDKNYRADGAAYSHLLKACIKRQEVIPESIGLTTQEAYSYLEQLVSQGLIVLNEANQNTTIRYIPTTQGEEWCSWRNKVKKLVEMIQPIIPDINITPQL